MKVGWESRFG